MKLNKIYDAGLNAYGDTDFRGVCPKEMAEQITFLNWLKRHHPDYYAVAVHIANEGKRDERKAMRMKVEGMKTGASDIVIMCTPGFVCEIKRANHTWSSISDDQIDFLKNADKMGSFACVALGHKGAIEAFEDYLDVHK